MADVEMKRKPVFTAESIKEQLYTGDRNIEGESTWKNAEIASKNIAGFQSEAYRQQYRDAVNAAYDVYEKNKAAIRASDLLGSSQQELLKEQQGTLSDAYNTYTSNLYSAETSVQENLNSQLEQLDTLLTERAENMESYFNKYGEYYDYLIENYGEKLKSNALWREKFMHTPESDEMFDYTLGEYRLMTYDELENVIFDKVTNEDGSTSYVLNEKGTDFYDMMENFLIQPDMYKDLGVTDLPSFEDYLYSTDEELYKWYSSSDAYNYTGIGGVANTMKVMTGRASDDYEYSFLERMGALSESQVDKLFAPITSAAEELKNIDEGDKEFGKKFEEKLDQSIDNLKDLSHQLGIEHAMDEELKKAGIDKGFDGLLDFMKEQRTYNISDEAGQAGIGAAMIAGGAALGGVGIAAASAAASTPAMISVAAGSSALGPVGLVVGGIILLGVGIQSVVRAVQSGKEKKKQNKLFAEQMTEQYQSIVNNMVLFAKTKQQESNQNFVDSLV